MADTMRAYKSVWTPLDHIEYIIAAPNRGRATTRMLSGVKEGYRGAHYGQMRTVRAPEFDHLAAALGERTTGVLGWRDGETREHWGCYEHERQ